MIEKIDIDILCNISYSLCIKIAQIAKIKRWYIFYSIVELAAKSINLLNFPSFDIVEELFKNKFQTNI